MSKKAVISWGRFNPPTIGHEKLVSKLVSIAKAERGDPKVYLSHTQHPKKDPLEYRNKILFSRKSFGSIVKLSTSRTIIELMKELQRDGYKEVTVVAGSDRVNEYKTLLNKYNEKDYSFDVIKVVSAGERDPDAPGAEGMSASKMRQAAGEGDEKRFHAGAPSRLSKKDRAKLYNLVRKGMLVEEIILFTEALKNIEDIDDKDFSDEDLSKAIDEVDDDLFDDEDDDDEDDIEETRGTCWVGYKQLGMKMKGGKSVPNCVKEDSHVDEDTLNERTPLTLPQRIKRGRLMKRLGPKMRRLRKIRKFRMAPLERLQMRARKVARNLLRRRFAGDKGAKYATLSPSQKIPIDKLIANKGSVIERIAKRLLPIMRKKEVERIRQARKPKKEHFEKVVKGVSQLFERAAPQDSDIEDRKGTQPAKYHAGLKKSTKVARDAQFKKQSKMASDDPRAYKPAPGDATAVTKPSKYTKMYKDMFGESEALRSTNDMIKKEKERDKLKHDAMRDRARLQDVRTANKNEEYELTEKSMEALKTKSEKSGYSYGTLKKVYDRGVAAWRTGHRPGTTPQQWGYGRVNAFIAKQKSGRKLDHDTDLTNEYDIQERDTIGRNVLRRGAYKAAVKVLTSVLDRKIPLKKHSIEYYAADIARSYPGVDTKELVAMYKDQNLTSAYEEAPVIGGKKMERLGSSPGSYKKLVFKHLGAKAAEKIDKSDGNKLISKGKKTGNKDLMRKGSFIKNVIAKEEIYGAGEEGTNKLKDKYKKETPGQ